MVEQAGRFLEEPEIQRIRECVAAWFKSPSKSSWFPEPWPTFFCIIEESEFRV